MLLKGAQPGHRSKLNLQKSSFPRVVSKCSCEKPIAQQ